MSTTSLDDGNERHYRQRLEDLQFTRDQERELAMADEGDTYAEPYDEELECGLHVPHRVWTGLFPHQKEGLAWLYSLHKQNAGGILGDDMGLGKTIQICAFLASLMSMKVLHSVLLACPASVLWHWVREMHKWCPEMRVVLLHSSGTATCTYGTSIKNVYAKGGMIVTTYENLRSNAEFLIPKEWDYVILDEGHKIRNPDAEITLVTKQLRTVHRIILTGSPIQGKDKMDPYVYPDSPEIQAFKDFFKQRNFIEHIRQYNAQFNFTPIGTNEVKHSCSDRKTYCIQGLLTHSIGPLQPSLNRSGNLRQPSFAQIYMHTSEEQLQHRRNMFPAFSSRYTATIQPSDRSLQPIAENVCH
ncbi:hypothetical protein B5M09_000926 [Aphanomyces astaci]|uniref:Helicase ATP-binding domain-containing protein n=1 Tax=Aphanomyces astaci TaxID=112090 RepID=A0A3R7WDH9_APHAT|nr:hypothetical protein B5M09_000926 [Aphanomyces astaci]